MKAAVAAEAGELLEIRSEQALEALALLEAAGFAGVALFGKRIHLLASNPTAAETRIRALLSAANVAVDDIRNRPLSMEDVFVYRVLALERAAAGQAA